MKSCTLVLLCLLLSITANAQQPTIEGHVTDTFSTAKLQYVVIALLRSEDSILVAFTRTNKDGYFRIDKQFPTGKYLLIASLSSYIEYVETINYNGASRTFNIPFTSKSKLLKPVVVKGVMKAVSIRGDTVEFKADAYTVPPNATVDELLIQLPGFQVDNEGKISVNGRTIQKILVDGDEFFSDDPTLVSRTLRADMVDKVQLFDKKSEQAAFAGINDGKTTKTLNLKLKENKKKGYFGKVSAGGGDRYYSGNILFNRFNGAEKIALYGIASNTGEGNISWQDKDDYGATSDMTYSTPLQTLDDWNGKFSGYGFPEVYTGGVHYNNKWNDEKFTLNGELRTGKLRTLEGITSDMLYLLPGEQLRVRSQSANHHNIINSKFSAESRIRIDSFTEATIKVNDNAVDKKSEKNYHAATFNEKGENVNLYEQHTNTAETSNSFDGSIFIGRRFRTAGRLLTLHAFTNINKLDANGNFNSLNDTTSLNQLKKANSRLNAFGTDIVYKQSISKTSSISINYEGAINSVNSTLSTYNMDKIFDSTYSNQYTFRSTGNKLGLRYQFIKKSFQLEAGNDVGTITFNQQNKLLSSTLKRTFTVWSPLAELKYSAKNGTITSSFSYKGNRLLPSILLMQPLTNNTDPNNIVVGNPLLNPYFSNNFRLLYINSDFITRKTTWIDIGYNYISGDIATNETVDSVGRKRYQYINSDHSSFFYGNTNYSFPLAKTINMGIIGAWKINRSMNIVNGYNNNTKSDNYTLGLSLSRNIPKKLTLIFYVNGSYYVNHSSIQEHVDANFRALNMKIQADWYLPFKTEFHTVCSFDLRQKTPEYTGNANVIGWNTWISKRLLKNESLVAKAAVNDLLNQGKAIFRSTTANYISETRYDQIRRYFQLSLTWNFSNFSQPQQ